jgi:hypothetical protein
VISPAATKLRCLGIWQAPIAQQFRPWCFPVLGPHPKQRDTVVNFSVLPQPSAALPAAPSLQPPEEPGAAIRRIPKLPRDHAGAVPVRIHVSAAIPQIDMPAEAIDRLAAHAAGSPTFGVCAFAIGRRRRSICGRQSMLAGVIELPSPAVGCSAPSSKSTSQPIGADRVGTPIRVYR